MTRPQDTTPANPAQGVSEEQRLAAIYAYTSVAGDCNVEALVAALTAAIGAGGQAVAGSLWVSAKPEHAKIGWTYDFDQTERLSRAAEKATGYEATMEVVEFVMAEADRRHKSALAHPVQPGWRDSLLDKLAEYKNFELSWGAHPDDDTEACWQVHRVNGGRNDREWTLIGVGNTPHEALYAALPAVPKGE